MRSLIIETASEACSVALFEGEDPIAHHHQILGRGHAERLIPLIADLPEKGRAEQIFVSLGPGSFTGTRIGLAAARALGLAWGARVSGFPTLALVAASAKVRSAPIAPVSIAMRGGHGEYFVQNFNSSGHGEEDPRSLRPGEAAHHLRHRLVAGTVAIPLVEARGWGEALEIHPDARDFFGIPPDLVSEKLDLIYGRAPDATPSGPPPQ